MGREKGRASCQQLSGQGERSWKVSWAWRICPAGGRRGQEQLGNNRGWEKQGSSRKQKGSFQPEREGGSDRRGVVLVEKEGVGDVSYICTKFHCLHSHFDLHYYTREDS